MSFQAFRERVNIFLYDSKAGVLQVLRYLNLIVSLTAITSLIYYYGFPQTEGSEALLLSVIKASFSFYVTKYVIQFLYDFQPLQFLKRSWFEAVIMLLLIVEGVAYNLSGQLLIPSLFMRLGFKNVMHYEVIFIQLYFLITVIAELSRGGTFIPNFKVQPSTLFILSFLILILFGTGLLLMPEMTIKDGGMGFLDALFTSTSATCVTGLIVVDTATYFTFKGKMVIMLLMKLGGLNIITFGSFFAISSKMGVGVKQHQIMEDYMNKDSLHSSQGMLRKVFTMTIVTEGIGTLLLYFLWSDSYGFSSHGDKLFFSAFHAISAFNNAGFSIFTDGLLHAGVKGQYLIHVVIMTLVVIGGLGMMALFDIFSIKKLRERIKYPWKQIAFSTKIAVYFSLGLIAFGMITFFFLEYNNTLSDKTTIEALITSMFQSITTRTAGFSTVNVDSLTIPMLLLVIVLMMIGASSGSTGGGIKTSTFAVIWASTTSTMRTKKNVELFKRTLSQELILRAFSVLLFFLVGALIGVFLLSMTETHILQQEDRNIFDLIFEEISAFGTVGLSTGITSELSQWGKMIIIVSMFVGRVGMLTVAFFFGKRPISTEYKYPKGYTMIG